jgi:GNAT superfamily N-acetyltransferase
MRPHEIDVAVSVWREANVARGAPHGPERTARIRAKLSAPDALPFVAFRSGIVGMALAEPGRFDSGAGELDPTLLHISMVFVRPAAQRTGVGLPLVMHVLDVARSIGYRRAGVWTAEENSAARRLYERAGMTPTGKTAPLRSSVALQYECLIEGSLQCDLDADDVGALWAKVAPAPEDEGLELAGDELRAMRRKRRDEGGPNNRATAPTTSLSSI